MDTTESVSTYTDTIQDLCKSINKKISGAGGGASIMGKGLTSVEIPFFIPTGSTILDTIISNREEGGIPIGRIIEMYGAPSSGKSLIASHILANTQKMGGIAVYIDTENAINVDFLRTIGVDVNSLILVQVETVEKVFESIETIIEGAQEYNPKFITIVWDSLAATSDEKEMEGDYEASGFGMNKAKMLSKGFRKITQLIGKHNVALVVTNQVRANIGVMFGEKETAPGGFALPFYSSLRLKISKSALLKESVTIGDKKVDEVRGVKAKVKIVKSRIGPPLRECEFNIYFNRGIDDKDSWFDALVARGGITRPTLQKYHIAFEDGREFDFKRAEWKKLVRDNDLTDEVRKLLIKSHIITYDSFDDEDLDEETADVKLVTADDEVESLEPKEIFVKDDSEIE
jgi:recombination protein RecA